MNMSDEELIQDYKNGNEHSFQELMRRSLKPIYTFVRQYVPNTEEAEDIVQDTFFKAWKHIGRFSKGKKWKPWIFAIARNTALDYIKKKKAVPFSGMDSPDTDLQFSDTIEDTEPLAAELFEQLQSTQELTGVMTSLRPEYNSVLMLHYHQELTFEEIAIVMDMPMNTVKSWHRRALKQLKEAIERTRAPK
jgi:RNA polymerase sigma-70 factor (ECF subfamily)